MENKVTHSTPNRRDVLKSGVCALGLSLLPLVEVGAQGRGRGQGGAPIPHDPHSPAIAYHPNRCERCGDCRAFCSSVTTVYGWAPERIEYPCIYCGQCTLVCPGRAITEKYDYPAVASILAQKEFAKVASVAPSLRVSLGEMFGLIPGTNVQSKLVQGLRMCGFDYVFDTSFAADVVVMEEAAELVRRLDNPDAKLPLFTSCCPAWIRFAEMFYPELLPNLSTVKSPFLVQGALVKTWFAQKKGIDPNRIFHVALAPCTAKKYEITRPDYFRTPSQGEARSDLDYSLTTRETGYMMKAKEIGHLPSLESSEFDSLLGQSSGAGMIFGVGGGVLEATLRTAWWLLNGDNPPQDLLEGTQLRGQEPIKTSVVDLKKRSLRVARVSGTGNIRAFLDKAKAEGMNYDFVEMMACPGGCIGGGGQPLTATTSWESLCRRRANGLFTHDRQNEIRTSYQNREVIALYEDFLKKANSPLARQLLHTGN